MQYEISSEIVHSKQADGKRGQVNCTRYLQTGPIIAAQWSQRKGHKELAIMCNTKRLAFHLSVSIIQLRHADCRPTFVSLTVGRGQYLRSERRYVASGPLHWASPVLATFLVIKPTNAEVTVRTFTYYLHIQKSPQTRQFQLRTLPTQLFNNIKLR